ncbi:glycosyltransferase [Pseudomonas putida]|uniref:glycosyltransferase n=1 Tax=Pseudomonas putida TaxID=303 RepID=UPI001E3A214E|nr:glycosyltransferase [Pseudomonas putida]MCE0963387.1 glycosyltransferase [Pseudomonas putida]
MCSYNGERFLAEQIDSFERQTHRNWSLVVSDDGSQDGTFEVLQAYMESWGQERLKIVQGPQQGFVKNFLSLTCRTDIDADFFDQPRPGAPRTVSRHGRTGHAVAVPSRCHRQEEPPSETSVESRRFSERID